MKFLRSTTSKAIQNVLLVFLIAVSIVDVNCDQPKDNPYDVLEIAQSSTEDEVKQRFRELSKLYHPDKLKVQNLSNDHLLEYQNKFEQIASAYEFIKTHNFNPRYIRDLYHEKHTQFQDSYFSFADQIFYDRLTMDINIFMEWADYRHDRDKAREEERFNGNSGSGFYGASMKFIRYMIRNKMMTLGAFFISVGLFALFSSIRSKDKLPINKSMDNLNYRQPKGRNIAKPGNDRRTANARVK